MTLNHCCSCFEVIELLKQLSQEHNQLSQENSSSQKVLLEIKIILSDLIKAKRERSGTRR